MTNEETLEALAEDRDEDFIKGHWIYKYRDAEVSTLRDRVMHLELELEGRDSEVAELKAKLWVAKDSQLRTYDGLAQKADKYDDAQAEIAALKESFEFKERRRIDLENVKLQEQLASQKQAAQGLVEALEKYPCICESGFPDVLIKYPELICFRCKTLAAHRKTLEGV